VTFPKKEEDTPCYADFPGADDKVVYSEGTFVGYRHYTSRNIATAFPFGYGLSYTSFKLSDLDVQGSITRQSSLQVRVKVENTGRVAGRHVVLAFVRPQSADESHPSISLEGFAKTSLLQPGQEETVTISLDGSAFSRWQGDRDGSWAVQQGAFNVEIRENADAEPLLSAKVSIGEGWKWRGLRA
jgi:beta-glucosidase